jgi:hypothetical protein
MKTKQSSAGEWLLLTLIVLRIMREVLLILSVAMNYRSRRDQPSSTCLAI